MLDMTGEKSVDRQSRKNGSRRTRHRLLIACPRRRSTWREHDPASAPYGISATGRICRSLTISFPLVSGLKNSVITKLINPPTVPISIGTAKPM
jgi:hypothetical protein